MKWMLDILVTIGRLIVAPALKVLSFFFGQYTAKYKVREMLYREISWNLTGMHEVLQKADEEHIDVYHVSQLLDYRMKDERYEAAKRESVYHHLPEAGDIDLLYRDFHILRKNIESLTDPVEFIRKKLYQFGFLFIKEPFQRRIMLRVAVEKCRTQSAAKDVESVPF
jgi:hypothetical protein